MKKLTTLFTFFILSLFATNMAAQDFLLKDKSGFGPRIGYYKAPDAEDGTMFIGAQARIRGSIIGLELAAEYRGEQSYDVTGGEIKVKQIPLTSSLLLFVPLAPNFQPYGIAGLGAYYSFYDYDGAFASGEDAEVNLGYHLGFGLDLPLNDRAALNVDYRYLFLDGNNDDFGDKEYSGNVISGGLTFYF
ncbi:MAG: OmpW family outer membrane protein [Balneolaceae bacterium]